MELYKKQFEILNDKETRVMIAKAGKSFGSGSNKLAYVHISPVTHEINDGYTMQINHSSDKCINLRFAKTYSKNQTKAMLAEIRSLAAARLADSAHWASNTEADAFRDALSYLANLN